MSQSQGSTIIGFLLYLCGVAVGFIWARLRDKFASHPTNDAPPTLSSPSAPMVKKTALPPASPPEGIAAPPKVLPGEAKTKPQFSPLSPQDIHALNQWQKEFCDDLREALSEKVRPQIISYICSRVKQLPDGVVKGDPSEMKFYKVPFTGFDNTDARLPYFTQWVKNVLTGNITEDDLLIITGIGEKSIERLKTGMSAWAQEKAEQATNRIAFRESLFEALEKRVPQRVLWAVMRDRDDNSPPFDDWANDILEGRISEDDLLQMRMMGKKSVEQLTTGLREWKRGDILHPK